MEENELVLNISLSESEAQLILNMWRHSKRLDKIAPFKLQGTIDKEEELLSKLLKQFNKTEKRVI